MSEPLEQLADRYDVLADCRLMLRFARESGVELSPELRSDIAHLDALLKPLNLPSVSELPEDLVGEFETLKRTEAAAAASAPDTESLAVGAVPAAEPMTASGTELALKVHGALSKLVAPATALTLRATEPKPGKHGVFARMPKIVTWAAAAALVSALVFVVSVAKIAQKPSDPKPTVEQNKPEPPTTAKETVAPSAMKDGGAKP